jgi:phosphoribosyl 1,2-cyclic phosphate phosphodiesterase
LREADPHSDGTTLETSRAISIGSIKVEPIPALHGTLPVLGWRCGDTAYLTDCNEIPESSFARLQGVKNLVIDALRERRHSTHYSFDGALAVIERIAPSRAWFTHICHDFSHLGIERWIAEHAPDWSGLKATGKKIEPAHDGLRIPVRQEPNG